MTDPMDQPEHDGMELPVVDLPAWPPRIIVLTPEQIAALNAAIENVQAALAAASENVQRQFAAFGESVMKGLAWQSTRKPRRPEHLSRMRRAYRAKQGRRP